MLLLVTWSMYLFARKVFRSLYNHSDGRDLVKFQVLSLQLYEVKPASDAKKSIKAIIFFQKWVTQNIQKICQLLAVTSP